MRRDPHHVVHDRHGLLKDRLIDLLMDIAHQRPSLIVRRHVRLVDVPDLARFGVQNVTVDRELLGNLLKLFLLKYRHKELWHPDKSRQPRQSESPG